MLQGTGCQSRAHGHKSDQRRTIARLPSSRPFERSFDPWDRSRRSCQGSIISELLLVSPSLMFILWFLLSQQIKKSFEIPSHLESDFEFGIIGLHPCGDLAAMLMNFFLQCPEAKFVNLVGCCYMKLTSPLPSEPNAFRGYPLSSHLSHQLPSDTCLSYSAREIACHAIEQYEARLRTNNFEYLRVHSFRAAVEKLICKQWPHLRHSGLRSIKHLTTFEAYCKNAVTNLNIVIPPEDVFSEDTINNLANWKQVVIFYTLRLMFAPLLESIILYDRLMYMIECGNVFWFQY